MTADKCQYYIIFKNIRIKITKRMNPNVTRPAHFSSDEFITNFLMSAVLFIDEHRIVLKILGLCILASIFYKLGKISVSEPIA